MQGSDEALKSLLELLERTKEQELGCDEIMEHLDEFAELAIKGDVPEKALPLIQHHLELCKDCREECEALLRMLRSADQSLEG